MADGGFRSKLNRLFSNQIVVKKIGKGRLKVVDLSKRQTAGTQTNNNRYLYAGLHAYRSSGYGTPNTQASFIAAKLELYRDYEAMSLDPIIYSALDIYADEATKKSTENKILEIHSDDENIKKILDNLFYDILNIEFNLWPLARNLCKYGDFYWHLELENGLGVMNVTPIGSYDIDRIEGFDPDDPKKVLFRYTPYGTSVSSGRITTFEFYEIAHFRLLSDTNFLPYGVSMLEAARKEFKRLTLMEDAMMIHRIMRAPQRRVYTVGVGNLNPNDVDAYMQKIINKTKKVPYVDEATGQYNLKFNLQNMTEDIYIPDRGGGPATKVDTLDGLSQQGFTDDIKYVLGKLLAALKIPKIYLGYEEDVGGKAVAAQEDIRFARTIERIQSVIESELSKIAMIHLKLQGFKDSDLVNFDLKLQSPSIVYERQRVEILKEKIDVILAQKEAKMYSRDYMYKYLLNLSDDEIAEQEEKILKDQELEFRFKQLADEGNDPKKTGQIKGTPHEIASMHSEDGEEENDEEGKVKADDVRDKEETRGRPEDKSKFGSNRDKINGRDPVGYKTARKDLKPAKAYEHYNLFKLLEKRFNNKTLDELLD